MHRELKASSPRLADLVSSHEKALTRKGSSVVESLLFTVRSVLRKLVVPLAGLQFRFQRLEQQGSFGWTEGC